MISPEEYMSSPVITASPDMSAADISSLMDDNNIGSIIITVDGTIKGIVTERDLVRKVMSKGVDAESTTASDIMTEKVLSVQKEASLMEVAALMKEHTMRRLVVLDGDEPVGIITSRDIINLLVE